MVYLYNAIAKDRMKGLSGRADRPLTPGPQAHVPREQMDGDACNSSPSSPLVKPTWTNDHQPRGWQGNPCLHAAGENLPAHLSGADPAGNISPQGDCLRSTDVSGKPSEGWAYMPKGKGKEAYRADRKLFPMLISFLKGM